MSLDVAYHPVIISFPTYHLTSLAGTHAAPNMKTAIYFLLILHIFASAAVAQSKKDKVEVGVQSTSLSIFSPDFPGDVTNAGVGGRVTYNFNQSIAAEAEVNFLPQHQFILSANGSAIQVQSGLKVGKRFEKFGIFAKVRPGFLTVDDVFTAEPGPLSPSSFRLERRNFFTIDVGGVLELYPSRRTVVRFDAGDTAIRHPDRFDVVFSETPSVQLTRPAKFKHNFQFTAGVAFRLGDFPEAQDDLQTAQQERTPRFEAGVQFTSLFVDPPSAVPNFGPTLDDGRVHVEPGFGGRFTFNLTQNIAVEAEGNYYTRELIGLPDPSGHIFQAQFGGKVGKRWNRWGLFGKARPGFVGYSEVSELVSSRVVNVQFLNEIIPVEIGEFRVAKKYYPSIDIGGVVEFYVSPRWMARFDIGDTVIRYGEVAAPGFSLRNQIVRRPPETRHNLQFTSGIAFRF